VSDLKPVTVVTDRPTSQTTYRARLSKAKVSAVQEGKLIRGFSVTDICGQGAGASISVFAGLVGLLSLAGSTGL
jgi:hypothetical protein